jgi:acetyltransferase-like isoleucine patch superfamily enzyme
MSTVANYLRAIREPAKTFRVGLALVRGSWYKTWYRFTGKRFRAGRNFRVFGSLHVSGPGEVVFGSDVVVLGHSTPWTHSSEARIVIGDRVMVGDARFGCMQEITIGDDCLLARCSIMDTDFHSVRADRRFADAPVRVMPVHIANNVWVGQEAGILPGAIIGENSVVSFGAVCVREYPPNVVLIGNPAKVAMQIPVEGRERVSNGELPPPVAGADPPPMNDRMARRAAFGASLLLISALACGDSRVKTVAQMASTSTTEITGLERLRKTKVFFGHQSVGANILEGIRELSDDDPRLSLEVTRADSPGSVSTPALVEASIGRNFDPQSKADAFVAALRDGLGPDGGIALYKYCYLDVRQDTDIDALFGSYKRAVETVRAAHPEITLVHVTIPLTVDEGRLRRLAKAALGKPTSRDLNVKRNAYNQLIRQTFSARDALFDLARVESTRLDGTRSYFRNGDDTVYTLAAQYTDDGGHLNRLGRSSAARELLRVLSEAAERRAERIGT